MKIIDDKLRGKRKHFRNHNNFWHFYFHGNSNKNNRKNLKLTLNT